MTHAKGRKHPSALNSTKLEDRAQITADGPFGPTEHEPKERCKPLLHRLDLHEEVMGHA